MKRTEDAINEDGCGAMLRTFNGNGLSLKRVNHCSTDVARPKIKAVMLEELQVFARRDASKTCIRPNRTRSTSTL